jgi:diacylglycerol kinase (ATP)
MQTILLVNKFARQARESYQQACTLLDTVVEPKNRFLVTPKQLKRLLQQALKSEVKMVIIGGGDGTISLVAGMLAKTSVLLAVLPLGTANDFARTMKIPLDIEAACLVIRQGQVTTIPMGQATIGTIRYQPETRFFLNLASIGLGSAAPFELTSGVKRIFGKLAYPWAMFQALLKFKIFTATITLDTGQVLSLTNILHIAIGHGKFYGGGNLVSSDANILSGYFDISLVQQHHSWDAYKLIPNIRSGTMEKANNVTFFRSKTIQIAPTRILPVNLDGELHGYTPAQFTVVENALNVIAPR